MISHLRRRCSMKILFYRYGSICEPDMLDAFQKAGLTVIEECTEINDKLISQEQRLDLVEKVLKEEHPLFVFSINFYPVIADICKIYNTFYLCWTVDSPVPELFSESIRHNTNRIFLFDGAQYQTFSKYNPECIYHLPLAAATKRFDSVISDISAKDIQKYSSDISFVGSLYSEKNPLGKIKDLPDYTKGYVQGLVETALKIYGYNPIEDALSNTVIQTIKSAVPDFYALPKAVADYDRYVVAHSYLGYHIAEQERIRTLNTLANYFDVDLYTRSDISPLKNVRTHGGVQTLTEMPKIFHLSKLNLNMTLQPIQTGLPLRIFDIMGCGGFLMTNYQAELNDYFEIGVDMEAYSSMEELVDKCNYYLQHEEERAAIARNGYEKVKANHSYFHRINSMLGVLFP